MKADVEQLINELRDLKQRERNICEELASCVSSEPVILNALKSGLVRLNFPAPSGFYNYIKRNY